VNIPVIHDDSNYVANPNPNGETPFDEFWRVRASVLAVSQQFGPTGPEFRTDAPLHYWLVEDQYNDDLFQNMEVYEPGAWKSEWLSALMGCLEQHKGWAISIGNIENGHVLLYADRVMVARPTFEGCHDIPTIATAAKLACERFEERKNGPVRRQLSFVRDLLPSAMKQVDSQGSAYISTFDGYQLLEGNAIWILKRENKDEWMLDPQCSLVRSTAVTSDGQIHPEYCRQFWPYTDVSPPYWLLTYIVEDTSRRDFRLVNESGEGVASIAIDRVVSDDELKDRFKS
jgi:hypothetical protein